MIISTETLPITLLNLQLIPKISANFTVMDDLASNYCVDVSIFGLNQNIVR